MEPRWLITTYYVAALAAFAAAAKGVIALLSPAPRHGFVTFFLFAPALATTTWAQVRRAGRTDVGRVLLRGLVIIPATVAVYLWLPDIISRPDLSWWRRGYYAVIPFWIVTEAIALAASLYLLPAGLVMPPIHDRPWRSTSLADFWGRRWNHIFGDWLRQAIFVPLRRRPAMALIAAFSVSGLMHEWLVNLPLWLAFGSNRFGSMMLYFLLQAFGMAIERTGLRRRTAANRLLMWLVVLGPAPLVLNEGTLRIMQLIR